MSRVRWSLPALAALLCGTVAAAAPATDERTGLVIAPGWKLVAAQCGGCHSYRLITAQRGDARFWTEVIRWMQRTQNLWAIPAAQERAMIDYLAAAYAGTDWGRRPALPARLMPPPE